MLLSTEKSSQKLIKEVSVIGARTPHVLLTHFVKVADPDTL